MLRLRLFTALMKHQSGTIHVLHIPRWYPHRGDPMLGLFVRNHIESLTGRCENSVLYLQFVEDQKDVCDIVPVLENNVFNCTAYIRKATTGFRFINPLLNAIRYFRAFFKCWKLIKRSRGKHDLVHVHVLTRTGLLALLLKILTRSPYVITEHWTRYLPNMNTFGGFFRKVLTRWVVSQAGAVMPVTANLRDAMLAHKLRNQNYVVVPNVVDVEKFKPALDKKTQSKKVFVHLSCFTDKQKNISGILRVMKALSQIRTDFVLKLIGDGEDFEQMKSLANQFELSDEIVIFTGLKQDEELVELLNHADLMIMFSNFENLPVVILESYACGVPVISTRVGGIHEHLNDSLGRLIPARHESGFLKVLNDFLDNPQQYDPVRIREYAVSHFSREVIGDSLMMVYTNVMKF